MNYYNENNRFSAEWLRNLIDEDLIAPGDVDERDIWDVKPKEIDGYTQCHFFAGIGIWSLALRQAGWPDERPVWTGSCPCQPFSTSGKGKGFDDERHLWPAWFWLICQCRPSIIFGEQVAGKRGLTWFDLVSTDLEAQNFSCGAITVPACGVGAPHMRQRLWFVAHSQCERLEGKTGTGMVKSEQPAESRGTGGVAHTDDGIQRSNSWRGCSKGEIDERNHVSGCSEFSVGNSVPGPINGFWRNADWLSCRDEKWRPVEPGSFPLVDGDSNRVEILRAYGSAIVPQVAREVIVAYMESCEFTD